MKAAARSDMGRVRTNNEDSFLADPDRGLFIVADGMGGITGGEVASALAVSVVSECLRGRISASASSADVLAALEGALVEADSKIKERTRLQSELSGMGTTIILTLVRGDSVSIAHVGDSRGYLVRGASIRRLTEDHTVVAQIVRSGMITDDEARTHKLKHVLSQALGSSPSPVPGLQSLRLHAGDAVILCTDGVTDMVDDEELGRIVQDCGEDVDLACRQVVARANENGGRDNITVVVIRQE
jgi:PPM family protein phosphatase